MFAACAGPASRVPKGQHNGGYPGGYGVAPPAYALQTAFPARAAAARSVTRGLTLRRGCPIAGCVQRGRCLATGATLRPGRFVALSLEEPLLKSSLSVVLPVCNDQANLSRRLSSLLEVLPELAGRFEMAVIDHGSSDATAEVAHEMAAGYPQLCVLSYPRPLDGSSVLRHGLQATSGEMVLCLMDPTADPHDFHRLVRASQATDAVAGRLPPPLAGGSSRPETPSGSRRCCCLTAAWPPPGGRRKATKRCSRTCSASATGLPNCWSGDRPTIRGRQPTSRQQPSSGCVTAGHARAAVEQAVGQRALARAPNSKASPSGGSSWGL